MRPVPVLAALAVVTPVAVGLAAPSATASGGRPGPVPVPTTTSAPAPTTTTTAPSPTGTATVWPTHPDPTGPFPTDQPIPTGAPVPPLPTTPTPTPLPTGPDTEPPSIRCTDAISLLDTGTGPASVKAMISADDRSGIGRFELVDPARPWDETVVRDTYTTGWTSVTAPQGARVGNVYVNVVAADRAGNEKARRCWVAVSLSRIPVSGAPRGSDAVDTAADASRLVAGSPRTVYIAAEDDVYSAMAASSAADDDGGLLYSARDTLPAPTRDALARLRPTRIVVVGDALSQDVVAQLGALAPVERRAGTDATRVSADTAVRAWRDAGRPRVDTVHLVVAGQTDAAVAAVTSRSLGTPVLVSGRAPSAPTLDAVRTLAPRRVVLVGPGWSYAASATIARRTHASVTVQAGTDVFDTAARLAPRPASGVGFVVNAQRWAEAFAVASQAKGRPVYLATKDSLPPATAELARHDGRQPGVVVVGTPATIADSVQQAAFDAATAG